MAVRSSFGFVDTGGEVSQVSQKFISVTDITEDVLRRSGIRRGMRVLEIGCGAGDTSLWIAKLVGPTGLVVAVDESAEAIDLAEKRATVAGQCYWTRFVTADLNTFDPREPFDAVVVQFAHPVQCTLATFLRLSACIHPDGIVMVVSGKPTGSNGSTVNQVAPHRHDWRVNNTSQPQE